MNKENTHPKDDKYHHIIYLMNHVSMEVFCGIVEIHTLELPKVKTSGFFPSDEREKKLVQWLRFFKAKTKEEFEMLTKERPILKRAFDIVKLANGSKRMKAIRDQEEKEQAFIWFLKNGAYTEGLSEGHTKGLSEGIQQGAKEKTYETARKMKLKGLAVKQIAEITELLPEDIEKL
jgi:predicted transposase/invertase (TIGR01784 family)